MEKKCILVADDDDLTREAMAEVLQDEGYDVLLASNGEEAVSQLATNHPHLILTDLQMPGLDGLGILTHVRDSYPTLPVIIFTADITIDAERTAKRLGAKDYINKPLNFADVLTRIAHALTLTS